MVQITRPEPPYSLCRKCAHGRRVPSATNHKAGWVGCAFGMRNESKQPQAEAVITGLGWLSNARAGCESSGGALTNDQLILCGTTKCGAYSRWYGYDTDDEAPDINTLRAQIKALNPEIVQEIVQSQEQPKSYGVKLTYFKPSGKFYAEGEYVTKKITLPEIWAEVENMDQHPGLAGEWSGIIQVDVPDHGSNHPHLIVPEAQPI